MAFFHELSFARPSPQRSISGKSMCYALYIGTDFPCDTSKWYENDRKFYIEDLHDRDKNVVKQFTKPYVYFAGSWQCCGCGFFSEPEWATTDEDFAEIEETEKCISDFVAFLNRGLEKSNEIELFVCWEGDQGEKPERKLEATPDELLGHTLPFEEMYFVTIKKKK